MRLVVCPHCGHENRATIVVTLCDRCGDDISSLAPARATAQAEPPERQPARREKPPAPSFPAAPQDVLDAPPAPASWAREFFTLLARVVVAAAAIAGGVVGSQRIEIGTALSADPYVGGSVAILAAAAALSGLVIVLVGSGPRRSQSIGLAVRLVGFLLALFGVLVAVALVMQPAPEMPEMLPDMDWVEGRPPPEMGMEGPISGPQPGEFEPPGPGFPDSLGPPGTAGPEEAPDAVMQPPP